MKNVKSLDMFNSYVARWNNSKFRFRNRGKIISVLKNASSERTLLFISHRLSSILTCDKVIKLENKMILQEGEI